MKRELNPVGQWYVRRDTQEMFQVIDVDERAGTRRIQMFDGNLDELDDEAWRALSPQTVEPPEDWTGPLDSLEIDDHDEFISHADAQPMEPFTEDREPWEDLTLEETLDAEGEQAEPEREPHDGHWRKQPFETGQRSLRRPSQPGV